MELRHLRALEAVLTTGSFTAAAAARHLSQPALWAQVKELEAELGLELFMRAGRGVVPTAACLALRPRLRAALGSIDDLRHVATEIREGAEAPARIGCSPTHVGSFLAGCVRELTDRDPRTPFPVIVHVTTGNAIETLAAGGIDLLGEPRAKRPSKDAALLYPMHVVAVGPAVERANRRGLDLRALDGAPIATMPSDSLVARLLTEAASRAGVRLRILYETRDASALFALAAQGLCTAVMHDEMLDRPVTSARLLARGKPLAAPIWLAWRPERALSPAARALRDVMRERARARREETI